MAGIWRYWTEAGSTWGAQHATPPQTKRKIEFNRGDVLLVNGYYEMWNNEKKHFSMIDRAREAGVRCAFAMATFDKEQVAGIHADEPLIDLQWGFGDAEVELPGYDLKILPISVIVDAFSCCSFNWYGYLVPSLALAERPYSRRGRV